MSRLSFKRVLCILSAAALVFASGCGAPNGGMSDDGTPNDGTPYDGIGNAAGKTPGSSAGDFSAAMGRYAETEIDLTEDLGNVSGLKKLPDGTLLITDTDSGIWESKDFGETWENRSNAWLDDRWSNTYFLDIQMAPDGTLGVIYNEYEEEAGEEAEAQEADENEGEIESDKLNEEEEGDGSSVFDFSTECALVKPDGTVIPVEIALSEDEMYLAKIWFSDSDRIFVTTLGDKIYEVHEDGSSELLLTVDDRPQLVQFMGELLIVDGYDFPAPLLYDLEKKEIVEAEELAAFIEENYGDRSFNGGSWYDLYLFPGEEGSLYLAGDKGLHRCRLEDGSIEQMIDGKLSQLGNPLYSLKGMIALGSTASEDAERRNEEFLAVSGRGKLIRFTYDPDMPSAPSESLSVYSLEDSYSIRTAISIYQVNHPEIYVDYEIGMTEGEGITREDALKKLNTRIVSGEGPDVLMMDGLPMDSYMEKGLLRDLTGLMESIAGEEDLFENLYQNMTADGKVFIIPTEIYLPCILGRETYVSKMTDLTSTADEICRLREEYPGKDLIYTCNAKSIMKVFATAAAPVWKRDNGEIDLDAVSRFLVQMKRIYDAQMEGLDEKIIDDHRKTDEYYVGESGEDWMYDITGYGTNELYLVGDYQQLGVGITTYPYGYWELTSTARNKGFEDVIFAPLKGMCGNVYIPATMLGINAASGKTERAEEFLREFLGKEVQVALGSYVLNRRALEEAFQPERDYVGENGEYGTQVIIDEDGRETHFSVFIASEEEMDTFWSWMESADTPYIADMVLEKTVFEAGEKYMQGEQGLEDTLKAIEQQLAIYLSE